MATAIWKDTYYTSTANTLEYYITDGTNTIFRGKSYKFPDKENIKIKINDICSNHLNSDIPLSVWSSTTAGSVTLPNAVKTFTLYNGDGVKLNTYTFYNDWSYTNNTNLSAPVSNKYAVGMWCLSAQISNDSIVVNYKKNGGNGYTSLSCGDYALYYSNIYGGWDSYLIEGKVVEGKTIEAFNYQKAIDNNIYADRENIRYQSNIKQNWVISTGYLSDAESKIIFDNLLTTNNIYLHNLKEDKIYPVNITDTQATYKEFLNERKLINYTINLKSDNLLIRK